MLEQSQPRRLRDVGGVAFHQLEFRGDGPDEPRELVHQAFPCLPIPVGGTPDQLCDIRGIEILSFTIVVIPIPSYMKTRVPGTRTGT